MVYCVHIYIYCYCYCPYQEPDDAPMYCLHLVVYRIQWYIIFLLLLLLLVVPHLHCLAAIYYVCECVWAKQHNTTFNLLGLGILLHWWLFPVCPCLWRLNKELTSLLAIRTEISFYKYVSNESQWNATRTHTPHLLELFRSCSNYFHSKLVVCLLLDTFDFFSLVLPSLCFMYNSTCVWMGGCGYFCTRICVCFHFHNYFSLRVMEMS